MATILERFEKLGLAISNEVLSKAGYYVSNRYRGKYGDSQISHINQIENGVEFNVCDYPAFYDDEMDMHIMNFVRAQDGKAN
jgi:hypothetical protein